MKRIVILLVALLPLGTPVGAQRLSRAVVPHHYELTLTPEFETDAFSGTVRIDVGIQRPTTVVELHALELEIETAAVASAGSSQVAAVELDPERETARLMVGEALSPGPATIEITYRGLLNKDLRGLYVGVDDEGRKYAASQMAATDARRAFPCFDEPWMKATFAISLVVDEEHAAFSNGAVSSNTEGPASGKRTIRFATTPRMSTYLVAMIVGPFDCLEDEHEGLPIRICASPEKIELGEFALAATHASLEYFEDYFDYPYPFAKLDQIAVTDFAAGAMENTAAVLYRETALLVDPETSSIGEQRRVAGVVAHEIAHMWFGDLVTMEWWDDVWLNEGFANFMENKAVARWKPEWRLGVATTAEASWPMETDVLSSTRRIRQQASTPEEIRALFDAIAYNKAAAVLRTIESYLGEDDMRRGIAEYIKRHAWGNTTAEDFYEALSSTAGRDVGAIMRGYVNQPGLPLVTVDARCEGDETVVTLTQQRFFADRTRLGSAPEQLWSIPVCFAENDCVLLSERSREARLAGCRDGAFANWGGRGYYLSAHGGDVAQAIALRSPAERLALLRDEWYLVRVGERGIGDYLELVRTVAATERERRVVDQYLGPLESIVAEIAAESDRAELRRWTAETLRPLAGDLGWQPAAGEDPGQMELRASVYWALGMWAADPEIRRQAHELAAAYLDDRSTVHPTMAWTVLNTAAREGDEELYDRYLTAYRAADEPQTAARFRRALGSFDDESLRRRNFELVLSDSIRGQDKASFYGGMINDEGGWRAVWDFATENWEAALAGIPEPMHPYIVPSMGQSICDEKTRVEFEAFAAEVETAHEPRMMAQARERIANCLDLKALHQDDLSAYLGRPRGHP